MCFSPSKYQGATSCSQNLPMIGQVSKARLWQQIE
jgi:hypothetical protein